uniref:Integrin subunit alpha L n=1 Tax=Homo sapiens TaxID=9606 RepID=A0A7I2V582_HUMAN
MKDSCITVMAMALLSGFFFFERPNGKLYPQALGRAFRALGGPGVAPSIFPEVNALEGKRRRRPRATTWTCGARGASPHRAPGGTLDTASCRSETGSSWELQGRGTAQEASISASRAQDTACQSP